MSNEMKRAASQYTLSTLNLNIPLEFKTYLYFKYIYRQPCEVFTCNLSFSIRLSGLTQVGSD